MADRLARIFGTEEDKVNCPFYFKIGACRHGDTCTRLHNRPVVSQTILMPHLYENPPAAVAFADGLQVPDGLLIEAINHFEAFYEEVFLELAKFGELEEMHVCDNIGEHLLGNVYAKFVEETEADQAVKGLNGRFYDGRQIKCEFSPVTDFNESRCRLYVEGQCDRGGYCNFMHLKHTTREFQRDMKALMYQEHPHYLEALKKRKREKKGDRRGTRSRSKSAGNRKREKRDDNKKKRRRSRSSKRSTSSRSSESRGEKKVGDYKRQTSEERRAMIAAWNNEEDVEEQDTTTKSKASSKRRDSRSQSKRSDEDRSHKKRDRRGKRSREGKRSRSHKRHKKRSSKKRSRSHRGDSKKGSMSRERLRDRDRDRDRDGKDGRSSASKAKGESSQQSMDPRGRPPFKQATVNTDQKVHPQPFPYLQKAQHAPGPLYPSQTGPSADARAADDKQLISMLKMLQKN